MGSRILRLVSEDGFLGTMHGVYRLNSSHL